MTTATVAPAILKLKEAAAYLRVSERTLWAMVKAGEVPHRYVGKQIRLSRAGLDEWMRGERGGNDADTGR